MYGDMPQRPFYSLCAAPKLNLAAPICSHYGTGVLTFWTEKKEEKNV